MVMHLRNGWKHYLYIATIIFFTLGFLNIIFALLGLICLILPFLLLVKTKRKTWCQGYCPRASLFNILFRKYSLTGKAGPEWFINGDAKWYVLAYFIFNIFVLVMSTFMVYSGRMFPMEKVRFLIALVLPWDMPNLFDFGTFTNWTIHLSFRVYSMMFTTTVIGLLLALFYKPRTWCRVCPINTVSDLMLKKNDRKF